MYTTDNSLYIAHCDEGAINLLGRMANRHGLIAGATGTGKTVTLQVMAETFSQAGVPCFMADMKGDLSGISQAGKMSSFIEKRCPEFGIENPEFEGCPVRFFDVYGEQGHPLRAKMCDMGVELLARLMELNDVQTGVLNIAFRVAEDKDLPIIDMKDLRMVLDYVSKHAAEYASTYGNVSSASVGAIQRALMRLDSAGADRFFGEPAFDVLDFITKKGGKGMMNVLAADKLMQSPLLYSTFLLWLLSSLYSKLPEVGDMDLPKLIFFFDEAHMMFDDASPAMVQKMEQTIRLIRSKGVGVYFITQSPADIPDSILGQLGNRVQHALRAFTPRDQKAVKVAAETFRPNPAFSTEEAIQNLATGEALVSFLDEKGAPGIVQKAKVLFPLSQIGAITPEQRRTIIEGSSIYGEYERAKDRESAYEILSAQLSEEQAKVEAARQAKEQAKADKEAEKQRREEEREAQRQQREQDRQEREEARKKKQNESELTKMVKSTGKSVFRNVINQIVRNVLKSFMK